MNSIKSKIIAQLKEVLEFDSASGTQWLLGVSIPETLKSQEALIVRVVVKTNESPLVDGMDIDFLRNGARPDLTY
jgi:hypothetical protein